MHRDVVPHYPQSVEKLGYSELCDVQGIYVKHRVITLQGHPEYNEKIAGILLDRRRGTLMDDETYQDGKKRVNNPHDGVAVGVGFLKFLLQK
jgi:GMP synthase-like glutamine amidotransferase